MAATKTNTAVKKVAAKPTTTPKAISKTTPPAKPVKAAAKPAPVKTTSTSKAPPKTTSAPKKSVTPKKTATAKKLPAVQVSDEQRYRMIAEAAYYRAESSCFQSDPLRDWVEAESDIDALLNNVK